MPEPPDYKPLVWIGSSYKDFCDLPQEARSHMGYALYVAQRGGKHRDAKPLKGFGGAGVLEIVSGQRGDTFRTMYTVRFADAVYVLHAFQKKSKSGRETPRAEIELVEKRLRDAEKLSQGQRT
jgi:phage-related protein